MTATMDLAVRLAGRRRTDALLRADAVTTTFGARTVLQDIDVAVPAGATVALVGRAGSGKTSLLRLLPRLFDATHGEVRIDGRDVREYDLAELRRAISMVPLEPFLFSTSIRDNLAFGEPELGRSDRLARAVPAIADDADVVIHRDQVPTRRVHDGGLAPGLELVELGLR